MNRSILAAIGLLSLAAPSVLAVSFTEDFSSDPLSSWSFGIGDNTNSQFTYNSGEAVAYTGDATGSLSVHFDSSLPTARLQIPLGMTLGQEDSFVLSAVFSFGVTSAPSDAYMQFAFGLVNSSLTGGDRTGSPANWSSDNVFHTFEFNYFPNAGFSGPTLQPAVIGAQISGTNDAFANLAPSFGYDGRLGDNEAGITSLPQSSLLRATLAYDGAAHIITLLMHQVNSDGSLSLLDTELLPVDLDTDTNYDTNHPFSVDALAIMAYNDAWTFEENPSLVGDMTFQRIKVSTVPEPGACGLLLLGGAFLLRRKAARSYAGACQ
jgi:hypothetical protein